MARIHEDPGQSSKLSKEQKTGFVFLLVFALLTVSLGFLQMRNTIYNPFVVHVDATQRDIELAYDDNVRLQQIDTDQDGLNDFEEINFYETSAYIPDTDSDGISDGEEIERGTNPLCPEGSVCGIGSDPTADVVNTDGQGTSATSSPFGASLEEPVFPEWALQELEQFAAAQQAAQTDPSTPSTETDVATIATDPDLLRALLLSTGQLTEEQLKSIDDQTLLSLAEELLNTNSLPNTGLTTPVVPVSTTTAF